MDAAFQILKNSLRQAAQAAGAPLENLIYIPEKPEDIISLFQSALKLEQINGNENYQQTQSAEIFRRQCSSLRLELLNMAKDLEPDSRILNLQEWGQSVFTIWTAIQENDDLVKIQDLEQINNHRKLVTVIENFRKMMNKAAPTGEEEIKTLVNPLLPGTVPTQLQDKVTLKSDETIFALFDARITELLTEQKNRDSDSGSLEQFIERKREDMKEMHKQFENDYVEQAKFYSEKMGPDLQYQAVNSVKNIILSIWQKSMNRWEDSQAQAVIESSLGDMRKKLNEEVKKYKMTNQTFTEEDFKRRMKEQSEKTRNNIRKSFFKEKDDLWRDA